MCLTCEFFDRTSGDSPCPPDGLQLGNLKGFGNANKVFEVRCDSLDAPALLVARCSKGKQKRGQSLLDQKIALLEEEMWVRRGYQIQKDDLIADHVTYVSHILAPQIGSQYLPLMMVASNVKGCSEKRAILMPDATALVGTPQQESVCLEIKPKFGSILQCGTIQDKSHRYLKHSKSRYSLHQTLKLQQGSIQVKSEYEPLDLFSGDAARMHAAIVALFKNPQNNLKVFIGGKRVSQHDAMCQNVCQVLFGLTTLESVSMVASLVSKILLQESVLEHILSVQMKCSYDVQYVETMLEHLLHNSCTISGDEQNRVLSLLADYCESATAKDCSVMITMSKNNDTKQLPQKTANPCSHGCISLPDGATYRYRITVVDLDRKSLAKIKSHAELDRLIMDSNTIHT